jgi:hypothetical protein
MIYSREQEPLPPQLCIFVINPVDGANFFFVI